MVRDTFMTGWRWVTTGVITWALTASSSAQSKTTFQDQILPLVENHCAKCHNPDKKKGDLDLTTYSGITKGGASGAVAQSGNPEASKLYRVLTHDEEPTMPPNRPRLADKDLEVFKRWILDGLLDNSGSKATMASRLGVDLTLKATQDGKPTGAPAIPRGLPVEPVLHTQRAGPVLSIGASPWAPVLAVSGQKQVLLYHSDTRELAGVLPFTNGQPHTVRFSRSGDLMLAAGGQGGKSGRVALWDVGSGKPIMVVGDEYDVALTGDISPDQTRVALGGPGRTLKIHLTATGDVEHRIKKHTDWITAVAFSPNGLLLASGDRNGSLYIWDPDSGQEIFSLPGHPGSIRALSWRGDSKVLASAGADGTIKTWELESGKLVKSWLAHEGGVTGLHFSHDGLIASCGRNGKVRTWDKDGNKRKSMELQNELPLNVAFSQDGRLLFAGTFSGKVLVWNTTDGKPVGELDPNPSSKSPKPLKPATH